MAGLFFNSSENVLVNIYHDSFAGSSGKIPAVLLLLAARLAIIFLINRVLINP
jgi:hypothetical protein